MSDAAHMRFIIIKIEQNTLTLSLNQPTDLWFDFKSRHIMFGADSLRPLSTILKIDLYHLHTNTLFAIWE